MAKVADFGLAKSVSDATMDATQTIMVGSIHWNAPEIAKRRYGKKTDVWAFAMTLYELLTRKLPFDGENMQGIVQAIANDERPDITLVEQPEDLQLLVQIMQDCWTKAPGERPNFDRIVPRLAEYAPRRNTKDRRAYSEIKRRWAEQCAKAKQKFDEVWVNKLEPQGGAQLLSSLQRLAAETNTVEIVVQPHEGKLTPEALRAQAVAAAPQLLRAMRKTVEAAGGTFQLPPPVRVVEKGQTVTDDDLQETVKDLERIIDKTDNDYDGDCTRVVDLVRASGVFETPSELDQAIKILQDSSLRVIRVKDRFNDPQEGYRDLLLNVVQGGGGHVAELQLHLKEIIQHKPASHVSYAIGRGILENDSEKPE